MITWLLVVIAVFLCVFALLLIVPAVEAWRDDRRRKRRKGMIR
jgi:uncharacterized membrane protein YidH (DUF202 family)